MSISDRLRAIRSAYGLSQKEMAIRMALGEGTWQRYELDGHLPKAEAIEILAAEGFSIDWLVTGNGSMTFDVGDAGHVPGKRSGQVNHQNTKPIMDEELMVRIADMVDSICREENARLSQAETTRQAFRIYCDLLDFNDEERPTALRAILGQFRRDLRLPPTANSKSRA